jgi:ubiquinone/menaquinone biosynthesis C-methylase UbiE
MHWGDAAEGYHRAAEQLTNQQWAQMIWPMISQCRLDRTIDFASGRGRNTQKLLDAGASHVTLVDVHPDNIRRCKERFGHRLSIIQNNGVDLSSIPDSSHTLVYSWDAMVHFDVLVIGNYVKEFVRVLVRGGNLFVHHSNYSLAPGVDFRKNPHWRNFMTQDLMAHMLVRSGFEIIRQKLQNWDSVADLDCLTLARKT